MVGISIKLMPTTAFAISPTPPVEVLVKKHNNSLITQVATPQTGQSKSQKAIRTPKKNLVLKMVLRERVGIQGKIARTQVKKKVQHPLIFLLIRF